MADSSLVLVPDIPAQDAPFNNEYTLSVSTRPTGHGSPRTGIYRKRLRAPLTVTKLGHPNPPEVGILTGNGASALVSVTGGAAVTANGAYTLPGFVGSAVSSLTVRVNDYAALLDLDLVWDYYYGRLVDVLEVSFTATSSITLPGFAGSAASSMTVVVQDYGRLVDVVVWA